MPLFGSEIVDPPRLAAEAFEDRLERLLVAILRIDHVDGIDELSGAADQLQAAPAQMRPQSRSGA